MGREGLKHHWNARDQDTKQGQGRMQCAEPKKEKTRNSNENQIPPQFQAKVRERCVDEEGGMALHTRAHQLQATSPVRHDEQDCRLQQMVNSGSLVSRTSSRLLLWCPWFAWGPLEIMSMLVCSISCKVQREAGVCVG